MMNEMTIQAIGFVGVLFYIVSYQMRSNRALFLFQLLGCSIFCGQFLIMGAYTGAFGMLVNILRNLFLLKINDWKWVASKKTMAAILGRRDQRVHYPGLHRRIRDPLRMGQSGKV